MTASHMPASQKMYVGGALRSMRLSCTWKGTRGVEVVVVWNLLRSV